MENCGIVTNILLLITSLGLLYLHFANAYCIGHKRQVKLIFQTISLAKYIYKMMHIVICFKRL